MKNEEQEALDLAKDVRKAAYLMFFAGGSDREPDGTILTPSGQRLLERALRCYALKLRKDGTP